MGPTFCHKQTPFFLIYPLCLIGFCAFTLYHSSNQSPSWIYFWTPLALLIIGSFWFLSMLLGKEFTFQKIECDGKVLDFKTNLYQGKISWEEVEKFWFSDHGGWVVLYFLFKDQKVAERIRIKPSEIEENLRTFYAHYLLGLPKFAFPKDFSKGNFALPDDHLIKVSERDTKDVMKGFRWVILIYLALYLFFLFKTPFNFNYLNGLALGLFWWATSYYPLVRAGHWGFLKKTEDSFVFFQTEPIFSIPFGTPFEKDELPNNQVKIQFEPDSVKWLNELDSSAQVKQKYYLTCLHLPVSEFERFQSLAPPSESVEPLDMEEEI